MNSTRWMGKKKEGKKGREKRSFRELAKNKKKLYKIILSETHKNATRNLQKFAKEKIKKKHTPLKFKEKFDKINHSEEEKYASRASAAEFFKLIFN